ncbi:RNA polymerase sigma factor [Dyadobacter luticola]|uniref:Sigma-70 family RNA polymerase sigma factor n=1 Tax=Dyadobacter luticola TaxID=1979387 RepID=A0A5R9L152_9BACT|nr:sigma-70 family RNA polymerase sigma factor [Dyadobacter luticola]TLV02079.1 sigma-70 family RNA polymerase sigma factor [Dyadobacter luticola]
MPHLSENNRLRDAQLWKELVLGSEQALGALMHIHYRSLVNYGQKFIKDEEFLKDCIQEMFIEVWNRRGALSSPNNVRAYLFTSLRRKVYREGHKLQLFEHHDMADAETTGSTDIEFSPEWWLIEEESLAERTRKMGDLLNLLPKRQREVIYLKYYQELSREEIAQVLTISPQTVSNLIQQAFMNLRDRIKTVAISLCALITLFLGY